MIVLRRGLPLRAALLFVALPLATACSVEDDNIPIKGVESGEGVPATNSPLAPVPSTASNFGPKAELGRLLFNDTRLSQDDSLSCASCHDLAAGGDDGRRTAIGIQGQVGDLNTPTVLNASYNFSQFWDGRAATLREQIPQPVHNPIEMGTNWNDVLAKLNGDDELRSRFKLVYHGGLTSENIVDAIAIYMNLLVTPDSPFDSYLGGNEQAISAEAKRGYAMFIELGCASCHQGKNIGGNLYQRFGVMGDYFEDRGDIVEADYGRFNVTGDERDRFYFKVPTLRNVTETAPYFHDGSVETLEQAVRTMATYQLGRPISDADVTAIVAFLQTLTAPLDASLL
jgi:cytochrome c peroxidase